MFEESANEPARSRELTSSDPSDDVVDTRWNTPRGMDLSPQQRHSMVLKLVMSIFAVLVVLPWIVATWLFGNAFILVGVAEILEDGQGLEPQKFDRAMLMAMFALGGLAIHRARRAYAQNRRARQSALITDDEVDAEETAWLNRPGLWERWGPTFGSAVYTLTFLLFLLTGSALLDNPTNFPTLSTKFVAVLLLFFFMCLIWLPWKALNWSWTAAKAFHTFGMGTMWRNGLLTGLLATGVLTLNPLVLPVSFGVGSMVALDALGRDELAQSQPLNGDRRLIVPAQARAARPAAARAGEPDSLRGFLVHVGRQTEWGNEPDRATVPTPRRQQPRTNDPLAECFNRLYSNRNSQGRTEVELAMRRVHRRQIGHPDDEEIVHSVMVRVCDQHASVSRISDLGAYFNRAITHAIIDHHRNTRRLFPLPDHEDGYRYDQASWRDLSEVQAVRSAYEQLPPREKIAIEMHVQGSSYAEIADHLRTSESNARQIVSRARQRLQ